MPLREAYFREPVPGEEVELPPKQAFIPVMRARGMTCKRIAQVLGLHEVYVSDLCRSPLMKALIRQVQENVSGAMLHETIARIMDEAGPSIDRLVDLRDHSDEDKIKFDAAKALLFEGFLDRALPKRTSMELSQGTQTPHLPEADFMRFTAACSEAGMEIQDAEEVMEPTPAEGGVEDKGEGDRDADDAPAETAIAIAAPTNGKAKAKHPGTTLITPKALAAELGDEGKVDTFEF